MTAMEYCAESDAVIETNGTWIDKAESHLNSFVHVFIYYRDVYLSTATGYILVSSRSISVPLILPVTGVETRALHLEKAPWS